MRERIDAEVGRILFAGKRKMSVFENDVEPEERIERVDQDCEVKGETCTGERGTYVTSNGFQTCGNCADRVPVPDNPRPYPKREK